MKVFSFALIACLAALLSVSGFASEAHGETASAPRVASYAIVIDTAQHEGLTPQWSKVLFCSGTETLPLPSLADCPPSDDYDTVTGMAICHQTHEIPLVGTLVQTETGRYRIDCRLDLANAEPVGERICDYSRCFYTNSPAIWPDSIVDELER